MKKPIILIFICLACFNLGAQTEFSGIQFPERLAQGEDVAPTAGLNHLEVVLPPLISASLVGLHILEQGLFSALDLGEAEPWIKEGTLYAAHLPLYFVDPLGGLAATGFTVGLRLTSELLYDQNEDIFADLTYTGMMQTAFFSTYLAYRAGRVNAKEGIYTDEWRRESLGTVLNQYLDPEAEVYSWRPYNLFELAIAPFDPANLTDPMIYILPIAGIIGQLILQPHDEAIWTTGRAYIGMHEVSPAAGISAMALVFLLESVIIAVTEEAHFRGFIYEDAGSNYGDIAAKVIDGLYFPLVHLPTDIFYVQYDALSVLRNFVSRAVLTVYLDVLYDKAGLPRSVAAHFWIDWPLLLINYLLKGGEPMDGFESIMMLVPAVNISYRVWL